MAEFRNYQSRAIGAGAQADASIDQGLRAYMIRVYNLMGLGLLITAMFSTSLYFTFRDSFVADPDTDPEQQPPGERT